MVATTSIAYGVLEQRPLLISTPSVHKTFIQVHVNNNNADVNSNHSTRASSSSSPPRTSRKRVRGVHFDDEKNQTIEIPSRFDLSDAQRNSMFSSRMEQLKVQKEAVRMARQAAKEGKLNSDNSELRGLEALMPHYKRRMCRMKTAKKAVLHNQTYTCHVPLALPKEYANECSLAANAAYLQAMVDQHELVAGASSAPTHIVMAR